MIVTIVLAALIFLYCAYIIRRKLRNMKDGNFCGCAHCDGCCGRTCSGNTNRTGEEKIL